MGPGDWVDDASGRTGNSVGGGPGTEAVWCLVCGGNSGCVGCVESGINFCSGFHYIIGGATNRVSARYGFGFCDLVFDRGC